MKKKTMEGVYTISLLQVIQGAGLDEGFPAARMGTTAGGGFHGAATAAVRLTDQGGAPCLHPVPVCI